MSKISGAKIGAGLIGLHNSKPTQPDRGKFGIVIEVRDENKGLRELLLEIVSLLNVYVCEFRV